MRFSLPGCTLLLGELPMKSHTCSNAGFRLLVFVVFCSVSGIRAAETPAEWLKQGWEEYRFLSMDPAKVLFEKVLKSNAEAGEKLRAKIGLAMVHQYQERGSDLAKAQALYTQVLAENPADGERWLVMSNLADLHQSEGRTVEALALLDELIDESLHTVAGQDALRRSVFLRMGPFGTDESVAVADLAADKLASIQASREEPGLLPILHVQLGDIYFWADLLDKAAFHYEQFTLIGSADTTSYASQAANLYRLAKLYEGPLADSAKAAHFYTRLVNEYPNSNMMYYALERSVQLGSMSREEVRELNISGLTEEIIEELFAQTGEVR